MLNRTINFRTSSGRVATAEIAVDSDVPWTSYAAIIEAAAELIRGTTDEWVLVIEGEHEQKIFRGCLVQMGRLPK